METTFKFRNIEITIELDENYDFSISTKNNPILEDDHPNLYDSIIDIVYSIVDEMIEESEAEQIHSNYLFQTYGN